MSKQLAAAALAVLILPSLLSAQSDRFTLQSRFITASQSAVFTANLPDSTLGCKVGFYLAAKKSALRSLRQKHKFFAFEAKTARSQLQASQLPAIKGARQSKRLHLRASAECSGGSRLSNFARLKISSSRGSDSLSFAEWVEELRARLLARYVALEPAFPLISFSRPIDLQPFSDGSNRLLIAEQAGRLWAIINDSQVSQRELVLDISSKLVFVDEQGLLAVALDPDFSSNGAFYLNYTRASDGATVIARYTLSSFSPPAADPSSEQILLTVEQPFANHNGGSLTFGPDGYLYIALGDGGSAGDPLGHAQNGLSLLGKILRIDVSSSASGTYQIPQDNPFAGNPSSFRPEIFALGFRNPWRISFDSVSGRLWAADVGQSALEEVDIVRSGKNYGWNVLEGSSCYQSASCRRKGTVLPVAEYGHSVGQSITGGYVYRGESIPALDGSYLYGDFITGRIFAFKKGGRAIELMNTDINISSFGQDHNKELFLLSYGDGEVYKFVQEGLN
ncbi:MAG: PQQ-dependent sugar dehydrogenase [Deltaproteobacteria bacterium]|nr:PQQ-dependent sugar dehydrogenase [Deltaproteobacteria bacterium]